MFLLMFNFKGDQENSKQQCSNNVNKSNISKDLDITQSNTLSSSKSPKKKILSIKIYLYFQSLQVKARKKGWSFSFVGNMTWTGYRLLRISNDHYFPTSKPSTSLSLKMITHRLLEYLWDSKKIKTELPMHYRIVMQENGGVGILLFADA